MYFSVMNLWCGRKTDLISPKFYSHFLLTIYHGFFHRYAGHCVATTTIATAAALNNGNAVDLKMRLDYTFRCDFIVLMKRSNVLIMKNSLLQREWPKWKISTRIQRNSIPKTVPTENFCRTIHYARIFIYII